MLTLSRSHNSFYDSSTDVERRARTEARRDYFLRQAFPNGYDIVDTPATGLKCGLFAIIASVRYQRPGLNPPTLNELMGMLRSHYHIVSTTSRRALTADRDLTVDQLTAVLYWWGVGQGLNLQLGYIYKHEGRPYLCSTATDHKSDAQRIWVSNTQVEAAGTGGLNHWESMRPRSDPSAAAKVVAAGIKEKEKLAKADEEMKDAPPEKVPELPEGPLAEEGKMEKGKDYGEGKGKRKRERSSSSDLPVHVATTGDDASFVLGNLSAHGHLSEYYPPSEDIIDPHAGPPPMSSAVSYEMVWRPLASALLGFTSDPVEAVDPAQRTRTEAALLAGTLEDEPSANKSKQRWNKSEARGRTQCPGCLLWFESKTALTQHNCQAPPRGATHSCNHCGQRFEQERKAAAHMRSCPARDGDRAMNQCVHCNHWVVADRREAMGTHMNKHCPGHPKFNKNKCPTCGLGHESPLLLKRHINGPCPAFHSNSGVFFEDVICEKCHLKLNTVSALREHQVKDHPADEEKPFLCRVCGLGSAQAVNREKHERKMHTKKELANAVQAANPVSQPVDRLERQFWRDHEIGPGTVNPEVSDAIIDCIDCGFVADGFKEWTAHKRDCPGIKCRLCGYRFAQIATRDRHERTCQTCAGCHRSFRGMRAIEYREFHERSCAAKVKEPEVQYRRYPPQEIPNLDEVLTQEAGGVWEAALEEVPSLESFATRRDQTSLVRSAIETSLEQTQLYLEKFALKPVDLVERPLPMRIILPEHQKHRHVIRVSLQGFHPDKTQDDPEGEMGWDNRREKRAEMIMEQVDALKEQLVKLKDDTIVESVDQSSITTWLQSVVSLVNEIPWFQRMNHHLFDLRIQVPGGRGIVYPDDGLGNRFTTFERRQSILRNMRVHLGAAEYPYEAKALTKGVPRPKDMPTTAEEYAKLDDKTPKPVVIVIGRHSAEKPLWECLRQLFANWLVVNDFYAFHQGHANAIPPPSEVHSIWINGRSAADEFATIASWRTIPEWRRLIDVLNRADRQRPRPPVRIIIRSISGLNVGARRWQRFMSVWPDLDIQVTFGLRITFMIMARPRHMQLHGQSPRGFYYSRWFTPQELVSADAIFGVPPFLADAHEVNEFQEEELNARTEHLLPFFPDAFLIFTIRGRDRNEFD